MHILIVSYWYHPEPVIKPHDLAVQMVNRNHHVTVITGYPNYPKGKIYNGYRMHSIQRELLDGVNVLRVPMIVNRTRSGVQRVCSYTSFSATATAAGLALSRRPDLIWTYQIGLPGVLLGKTRRAPVVHEVQDLWPEWSQSGNLGVGARFYRVLELQERLVYRNSHRITTISEGFRKALLSKGVPGAKISVIPNWANEETFRPVPANAALAAQEALSRHFNVIYAGNVGTAQALGVILECAALLVDLAEVQFVIIGDGVERAFLAAEAAKKGLRNVRFLGSRPPSVMADYLIHADVLLIHLKDDPVYRITIPSKTYSYLAMGKPIIAAAKGEVADMVQKLGAGIVCPPENPRSLANAVRLLWSQSHSARCEIGEKGRNTFLTLFSREVLAAKYDELFRTVVSSKTPA